MSVGALGNGAEPLEDATLCVDDLFSIVSVLFLILRTFDLFLFEYIIKLMMLSIMSEKGTLKEPGLIQTALL